MQHLGVHKTLSSVDNDNISDAASHKHGSLTIDRFIQTEAERRRREAGVKQSMEIRLRSCMYVCMWVCMVFGIISRTKACTATNEVLKCRSPERALLRHNIIGVRLLTNARRAKMPK